MIVYQHETSDLSISEINSEKARRVREKKRDFVITISEGPTNKIRAGLVHVGDYYFLQGIRRLTSEYNKAATTRITVTDFVSKALANEFKRMSGKDVVIDLPKIQSRYKRVPQEVSISKLHPDHAQQAFDYDIPTIVTVNGRKDAALINDQDHRLLKTLRREYDRLYKDDTKEEFDTFIARALLSEFTGVSKDGVLPGAMIAAIMPKFDPLLRTDRQRCITLSSIGFNVSLDL